MNTGAYIFPALRIRQGEHQYYLIQCPLRLIPRLLLFDEGELPASIRRAQTLDPASVASWEQYLAAHPADYVLPPLITSVDGDLLFEPLEQNQPDIGRIQIALDARLLIRDGQHRRAAIQVILATGSALADDTVPVMLIPDPQLRRATPLYSELHPAQPRHTMSRRVLHDRNDLAVLVRQMVDELPLFHGLTEIEKTTISNRSTALFTLSAIYQATRALLHVGEHDPVSEEQISLAYQFWQTLGETVPQWRQIITRETTASALRQNYIHSHTVTLLAIGMAGHALMSAHPAEWRDRIEALGEVNWSRTNTALWEGRAMLRGKMSKTRDSICLTASAIKQILGLALTERERELERLLAGL